VLKPKSGETVKIIKAQSVRSQMKVSSISSHVQPRTVLADGIQVIQV